MYEKCDTFVSLINFKVISEKSVPFSNACFFFFFESGEENNFLKYEY